MKIAIASGKGGTGKTMIATSLAISLADQWEVDFVDCDIEAPNGHLFLKPDLTQQIPVEIQIPRILSERCTGCGKCVEVCQYHALAKIGKKILVFPQLCHGCGSCTWNCPEGAVEEIGNPIGILETGMTAHGIRFYHGLLTVSEPMPAPVIRALKRLPRPADPTIEILDAPPGASCSVVETLRGADAVILVTEPTPFGLHDLKQMLGILREMGLPAGVIVNRDGLADSGVDEFLSANGLPVYLRIPFDRSLAEALAAGVPLVEKIPSYRAQFLTMIDSIISPTPGGRS